MGAESPETADLPSVPHLFTSRSGGRGQSVTFVLYVQRYQTPVMSRLNGAKSVNFSSKRLFAGAIVACLALAACGGDDDDEAADTTSAAADDTEPAADATEPPADDTAPPAGETAPPADATEPPATGEVELAAGDVFISGSSTVEPISIRVGELAGELSGGELKVTVEGPGTGDGFQKFCGGETDISDASRPINDEEAQACADAGIEYVELEIAIDGLTVATNPANADIECLDVPALYALIGPESEGFANWSDANDLAAEVASAYGPFPDVPLVVYGPGEESGTYDTFVEFAIGDLAEERGADEATRADYTSSANDNLIVQGIESSDTSIGWVGYAYFVAEQERMKAIAVDGGDGCVEPTPDTIGDGSYPFSRSLYIYVNTGKAAENPAVASFVDLYLSEQGLAKVGEAGYVDLPADRIQATKDAWAAM
jgi:phosphate transport system substrate-binding protein